MSNTNYTKRIAEMFTAEKATERIYKNLRGYANWILDGNLAIALDSRKFCRLKQYQRSPPISSVDILSLKLLWLATNEIPTALYPQINMIHARIMENMENQLKELNYTPPPIEDVPEIEADQLEEWLLNYSDHPVPFIVRGYFKDTYACKNWSAKFFKDNYGDHVHPGGNPVRKDTIKNHMDKETYVNFLSSIWTKNPELATQAGNSVFVEPIRKKMNLCPCTHRELFIAVNDKNGSDLHQAAVFNFFEQVAGTKVWTMVHPNFTHMVYPLWGNSTNAECFSVVSCDESKNDNLKLWKYVPKYRAILHKGDLFYNPPAWWHMINNKKGDADATIGITLKFQENEALENMLNVTPNYNTFAHFLVQHPFPTMIRELAIAAQIKMSLDDNHVQSTPQLEDDEGDSVEPFAVANLIQELHGKLRKKKLLSGYSYGNTFTYAIMAAKMGTVGTAAKSLAEFLWDSHDNLPSM